MSVSGVVVGVKIDSVIFRRRRGISREKPLQQKKKKKKKIKKSINQ